MYILLVAYTELVESLISLVQYISLCSNVWCSNTEVALSVSLFRDNRYYNLLITSQLFLILVDVNECWRMLTLLLLSKLFDVV